MIQMQASIAMAKITLPRSNSKVVRREPLLQALDQALSGKLTIVHAPAGYGKTSLLADWGSKAGRTVAWMSLDSADNDDSRFWRGLTHSFAAALGEQAGDRLLQLADGIISVSRHTYIDALLNELALSQSLLLCMIDDYHTITSERHHEHMAYFIDYMPDNVHLVIASRQPLPFPTMKLKLNGTAAELTIADLRFTLEEAELLLRESGSAHSGQTVDRLAELLERTEGWITGMMLVQMLLRSGHTMERALQSFRGHERLVSDYLFQEAVATLPSDLRDFLSYTSVLSGFDETFCNEVTGRNDGGTMLERILDLNLFLLPMDERSGRYRYHRLFAEYWADHFRREQPDEWRNTHRKASALFARHGLLHDAIEHASRCGEYAMMERLLGQHIPEVLRRGELTTLLGWFGSFPADYPLSQELSLLHAFVLVLTGQPVPAEHLLRKLEQVLLQSDGSNPDRDVQLRSGILFVRSNLVFTSGEYEDWLAFSNGILNQLVPENPTFYNFNYNLKEPFVRKTVMGMNGVLSPETESIAKLFSGTMDSHGWERSLINLYVKQSLAEGYYEWNRLEDSQRLIREIETAVESRAIPGLVIPHRLTEASILTAKGDAAQAELVIDDAIRFAAGLDDHHWLAGIYAYITRRDLSLGHLTQAKNSAKKLSVSAKRIPTFAQEYEYLTLARLLGRQRKEKEALRILELLGPQARREGQLGSLAEIAILQALYEFKLGYRENAWRCLEEALAIGAANGYVRIFADEGTEISELLHRYKEHAANLMQQDYLDKLIAACPAPPAASPKKELQSSLEPLNRSEIELLRQLQQGSSNKKMSAALHLSEGTVKVYLSTLYAKLGVSSRTQALIAAQERKLL